MKTNSLQRQVSVLLCCAVILIIATSTQASAQNQPIGSEWVARIYPTDGRPCVFTPQWNEWQLYYFARLELGYSRPNGQNYSYPIAPVTWSNRYYGETEFQFLRTSMTEQTWQTDGTRCFVPGDRTWQQTLRAEITYQGRVYTATFTAGGPEAATYQCCYQNCCTPQPIPCGTSCP